MRGGATSKEYVLKDCFLDACFLTTFRPGRDDVRAKIVVAGTF